MHSDIDAAAKCSRQQDGPSGHHPQAKAAAAGLMIAGDLMVLTSAVMAAVMLRGWTSEWFPIEIGTHVYMGIIVAVAFLPLGYAAAHLYPGYGLVSVERMRRRITVTAFGFGAMILFDHLAQDGQWSRGILVAATLMAIIAVPVWDAVCIRLLMARGWWGEPVVVLGPPERRRAVIDTLRDTPQLGWLPIAEAGIEAAEDLRESGAELALVVVPAEAGAMTLLADDLPFRRIVLVPDMDGMQSLWVTVRDLGTHIGLEMRRNLHMRGNRMIKRGLDLVVGSLALVCAAPMIALAAMAIVAISPGPAFYAQVRTGRDRRAFRMWKLRTMRPGADALLNDVFSTSEAAREEWSRTMKLRNDPRIIRWIGNTLRRFSIDELPQLWNVVRGDMSLVGPRPLPDYHFSRLDEAAAAVRQRVAPGITGLWQVSGRSGTDLATQQYFDVYYVRNWSLWIDIHILARTILVVLSGKGAW